MTGRQGLAGLRPVSATRLAGVSTADAVHSALQDAVMSGRLAPATRLTEEELARVFDVSRTPVREALSLLEAQQVVRRDDRGRLVVAEVTADDIVETDAVRQAIDGLAARLASEVARARDVDHLRWLNAELARVSGEGMAPLAVSAANLRFHEAVCTVGGNRLLLTMMQALHGRVSRFHGTTFTVPGRSAEAVAEHEAIIDAIEAHDADAAEAAARAHIASSMRVRTQLLRERRSKP
ncbi:MAG TPA: GntR family transcriptional regulator [Nocardioides sp.]|jgi:DNA-binding GntR family transcriptional regulator|uniref:GntR family transcriptional regulator n=1 Tax=Nocardioides sp. TaxID=35761 RepID=UPI002E311798|nr:GntR family transcriptional regulator [Nocardioides sp.]HEX3931821.1 GntR family transcriptional regulator [Nocardioides sp.]